MLYNLRQMANLEALIYKNSFGTVGPNHGGTSLDALLLNPFIFLRYLSSHSINLSWATGFNDFEHSIAMLLKDDLLIIQLRAASPIQFKSFSYHNYAVFYFIMIAFLNRS